MRTTAELASMSCEELKDYEQSLLALWTPRIALENDIERLRTHRSELLEIFKKLKHPGVPENERLKNSILSLNSKIEDLEDELDDLIQDERLNHTD
ncbi:hypothetical protein HX005_19185 [Acinetobacter sp. R933-2]|uniref:hypothetical protein n=1 Tax=unclassified Acinetobacter TaxID=196816 RepID=UPI000EA21C40|nr:MULTISPECIES: hypothetical protein [unclassified Acinetobacter]MDM1249482.1 hypothetical protein [Acinetobacter sp. R933-2]RKG37446.1 hypothetical protein D7V31_16630 [Acinetobacter sp. WCHAc060007]